MYQIYYINFPKIWRGEKHWIMRLMKEGAPPKFGVSTLGHTLHTLAEIPFLVIKSCKDDVLF